MNENARKTEAARRESALAAAGGELVGDARTVAGREIRQMLSLRMDPRVVRQLRRIADRRGTSVSDLLREAATRIIEDDSRSTVDLRLESIDSSEQLTPTIAIRYWDGAHTHDEGVYATTTSGVL
jgi:uncharacterized protein (DUF4415 family)